MFEPKIVENEESETIKRLKRSLNDAQIEIQKLKDDLNTNHLKIEAKNEKIKQLERKLNEPKPKENKELENLLRQEAEALSVENRSLKDKIVSLSNDIDRMTRAKPTVDPILQQENQRLKHDLQEIRRDNDFITSECNDLRTQLAQQNTRQKSEFADVYATMKRDSDELKKEIRSLNYENEKLLKQLEMARSVSSVS